MTTLASVWQLSHVKYYCYSLERTTGNKQVASTYLSSKPTFVNNTFRTATKNNPIVSVILCIWSTAATRVTFCHSSVSSSKQHSPSAGQGRLSSNTVVGFWLTLSFSRTIHKKQQVHWECPLKHYLMTLHTNYLVKFQNVNARNRLIQFT